MRKMYISKFSYNEPLEYSPQYLAFYPECEHPDTEIEILMFTPAELEEHERKVWEAAAKATSEVYTADCKGCIEVSQVKFQSWKKEQEK